MRHDTKVTLEGRVDVLLLEPGKHHKVVVHRPKVRAARQGVFMARPGSGVALVGPWSNDEHIIPFVLGAVHAAAQLEDPVVLVVGLCGRGEPPEAAVARARGVDAIVRNDRSAWVACATEYGGLADIEAFLHYLNAMHGWGCYVSAVDGVEDEDAASAVQAFQAEYNRVFHQAILEDGVCGEQTLGAVFDVVRDEWTKWLYKHDLSDADVDRLQWSLSNEALEPAKSSKRGAGGVDLWVLGREAFEGGLLSAARVAESKVTRWAEYEVPPEPWAWAAGPFTIVTDLPPGEVVPREEYRLWSSDGSFDTTLAIPDDSVSEGVQTLRFFGVPCDKDYSLSVSVHGDSASVLFEGVPYNKLHKISRQDEDE